jgi:hypothetical protein
MLDDEDKTDESILFRDESLTLGNNLIPFRFMG